MSRKVLLNEMCMTQADHIYAVSPTPDLVSKLTLPFVLAVNSLW